MRAPADLAALPRALTVKQTAELANANPATLYDAIAAGTLPWPVLRIGRAIRIPKSAVLASLGLATPDQEP